MYSKVVVQTKAKNLMRGYQFGTGGVACRLIFVHCSAYFHPDNLTPITIKEDQLNVCFYYGFDKEKQWK